MRANSRAGERFIGPRVRSIAEATGFVLESDDLNVTTAVTEDGF